MTSNWIHIFIYHTPQPYSEALYYLYEKGLKEIVVAWNVTENEEPDRKIAYTMITSVINAEDDVDYHIHDDAVRRIIKFAEGKHEDEVMMRLTLDENKQLHIEQLDEADVNAYTTRLHQEFVEKYYKFEDLQHIKDRAEKAGIKVDIYTKESELVKQLYGSA